MHVDIQSDSQISAENVGDDSTWYFKEKSLYKHKQTTRRKKIKEIIIVTCQL